MTVLPAPVGANRTAPTAGAATLRVALLAPYAGTNLGDAAIQEAAIQNIRGRLSGVVISGITLNPRVTAARHGIPCFPLESRWLEYVASLDDDPHGSAQGAARPAPLSLGMRVRDLVKRVPIVGPALRAAAQVARVSRREATHWARGFRLARGLDAIIVAGSGQLDDEWGGAWAHPYALFKWALLTRVAGKPFIVLSVGASTLRHGLSRWFVRCALRLACYRSYRDQGTKAMLRDLPFTRDDRCRPDLAFSLPHATVSRPPRRRSDRVRRVGVSPIAYGHPELWPTADRPAHERYLNALTDFVAWLVAQRHQVVLFATGGVDHLIIHDLLGRLAACSAEGKSPAEVRVAKDDTLKELLVELESVDAVVASRLHGLVLAHVLGKPAIALSFDRKVAAHMQEIGMEQYCLDLQTVNGTKLAEAFTRLEREAVHVWAVLDDARRTMRQALDAQYDAVIPLMMPGHARAPA